LQREYSKISDLFEEHKVWILSLNS
jgi:hypothetical protein